MPVGVAADVRWKRAAFRPPLRKPPRPVRTRRPASARHGFPALRGKPFDRALQKSPRPSGQRARA